MTQNEASDVYISIVAAAYNEEDNLNQLLDEINKAMTELGKPWEVIIANDCSSDSTETVLKLLMNRYPQLRVLRMKKRFGQTAALDAAIRNSRGRFISIIDADLQNDPQDIPQMLKLIEDDECDMVNGWRTKRNDPWIRLVSTKIANGVRNWLTNEKIHDSACGLRVFRRECFEKIKFYNGMHRFLSTLIRMEGYRVKEIPVNHRPRIAGEAKYGVWNRLFRALRDTFAVRWMQSRLILWETEELKRDQS